MGVGPIAPDAGSGSGVDATGVTAGYVPTAQGDDTFDWEPVEIDLPPAACSNLPIWRATAPVKAPFSWPNNSLSIRSAGMAAVLTATNGPFCRCPN